MSAYIDLAVCGRPGFHELGVPGHGFTEFIQVVGGFDEIGFDGMKRFHERECVP